MPALDEHRGVRLSAGNVTSDNFITGSGILRGILVTNSHATDVNVVTIYDHTAASGTVLLLLHVHPGLPIFLRFGRDDAIRFATGLSITYASCEVNLWVVELT